MCTRWTVWMAMSVVVTSCSGPDVQVAEATVEGHTAEAAKEHEAAAEDRDKYEMQAERLTRAGWDGPVGPEGPRGSLVMVNHNAPHLLDAQAHERAAKLHEKAAAELAQFEEAECQGISPAERQSCPTLLSDVVTPLANGICIHVGQKRAAGVLAYLRCHLAFARAHGYGGASLCAFAIPDVTAQATADYKGVELTSQNPQAVKILQSLVLAPFHGI